MNKLNAKEIKEKKQNNKLEKAIMQAEALRKDPHAKEITSMEDLAKDWGLNCEKSKHS
ncbi:MAG: hypothetical protein SPK55_07785 [Succinivibrio sp.]|nr:hypothetical protein [Succinivibrio sp.]